MQSDQIERRFTQHRCAFTAVMITLLSVCCPEPMKAVEQREFTLSGTSTGGTVYLVQVQQRAPRFVCTPTFKGESSEAVLQRLAALINQSDPFGYWWGDRFSSIARQPGSNPGVRAVTHALVGLPRIKLALTGTDRGLITLNPATSVSGFLDMDTKQIMLQWAKPSGNYDNIYVGGLRLPPDATQCVIDWRKELTDDLLAGWFGVVLARNDTLSPPASINLSTNSQEELDSFPFYMGVAPNWSAWSDSDNPDVVKLEQGTKPEVASKGYIEFPDDKPFYQIIKTTHVGAHGGVWRRFLGLKSGHTYKVEVRLNTLAMDACTNDWAYSFHAAHDNPDGQGLSVAQLAGTALLPNGSKGTDAGRVALYKPGTTTKGKWEKRSTDYPGPGLEIKNIILPAKVTSITVWLRHSGENSTGVGMDWIRLEDVTKNP